MFDVNQTTSYLHQSLRELALPRQKVTPDSYKNQKVLVVNFYSIIIEIALLNAYNKNYVNTTNRKNTIQRLILNK